MVAHPLAGVPRARSTPLQDAPAVGSRHANGRPGLHSAPGTSTFSDMADAEVKLAVIGGGAMARAVLAGGINAGVIRPAEVVVAEPNDTQRLPLKPLGVTLVERAPQAVERLATSGYVLLAVKPQSLADVSKDMGGVGVSAAVMSIMAGVRSDLVRKHLPARGPVVRVMPNLPAQIRKGVTAVALGAGASPGDEAFALRLFAGVGEVTTVDESLMDAFTALAGSGPAYLFYLAEAMVRAGIEMGFDPATADRVVRGVLAGSADLLAGQRERSALDMRMAVTSKGGTTEAAVRVLQDGKLHDLFGKAIIAARNRGAELAAMQG